MALVLSENIAIPKDGAIQGASRLKHVQLDSKIDQWR